MILRELRMITTVLAEMISMSKRAQALSRNAAHFRVLFPRGGVEHLMWLISRNLT
jgi:hypothetical protein